MSLEGIPQMSDTFRAMVYSIRTFIRDFPELNRLIRGEESSDRQIAWALLDALDDFNGTPPITWYSLDNLIQVQQVSLLRTLTVVRLLESVGLLQTRNHINYSDGGLNVGVNDKTPMIMQWLNYFKSTTEQQKLRVKVALNISNMLGGSETGVSSELWAVNASYLGF